ncbi:Tetratricopeptide repeat protein 25 [Blyttiomyces sp. JEL0837]|nr:Tetratricopeptide repeat protein 25 [Blyttiomyces sp. JEL0837]
MPAGQRQEVDGDDMEHMSKRPTKDANADRDSEGEPVSSFQSYAAEGDILAKQGDFRKAIEAYSKALLIRPMDKHGLVARSKCFLQLGESQSALEDADLALKEDAEFFKVSRKLRQVCIASAITDLNSHKGVFQKAEALYAKGDFEMALVFYHRGNKLRPELDEFRLGIQKAREAIDNSIGNPRDYKFQAPTGVRLIQQATTGGQPHITAGSVMASGMAAKPSAISPAALGRDGSKKEPPSTDKTAKQLLGELYADKEYLELLLNDKDFVNNPNDDIYSLVSDALNYLETRTEFWRQQKPIYARRKEHSRIQARAITARNRQLIANKASEFLAREAQEIERQNNPKAGGGFRSKHENDTVSPSPRSPGSARQQKSEAEKSVNAAMNVINRYKGDFPTALNSARSLLTRLGDMSNIQNLDQIVSDVTSTLGNICMELGNLPLAIQYHRRDLSQTRALDLKECIGRALGNLGRVCVKLHRFDEAIASFTDKLSYASPASLEQAWLLHDIGRCHLEMGRELKAKEMAEACAKIADSLKDRRWGLNAYVLLGQAEVRGQKLANAEKSYITAQSYAEELNDSRAIEAISTALAELRLQIGPKAKKDKVRSASARTSKPPPLVEKGAISENATAESTVSSPLNFKVTPENKVEESDSKLTRASGSQEADENRALRFKLASLSTQARATLSVKPEIKISAPTKAKSMVSEGINTDKVEVEVKTSVAPLTTSSSAPPFDQSLRADQSTLRLVSLQSIEMESIMQQNTIIRSENRKLLSEVSLLQSKLMELATSSELSQKVNRDSFAQTKDCVMNDKGTQTMIPTTSIPSSSGAVEAPPKDQGPPVRRDPTDEEKYRILNARQRLRELWVQSLSQCARICKIPTNFEDLLQQNHELAEKALDQNLLSQYSAEVVQSVVDFIAHNFEVSSKIINESVEVIQHAELQKSRSETLEQAYVASAASADEFKTSSSKALQDLRCHVTELTSTIAEIEAKASISVRDNDTQTEVFEDQPSPANEVLDKLREDQLQQLHFENQRLKDQQADMEVMLNQWKEENAALQRMLEAFEAAKIPDEVAMLKEENSKLNERIAEGKIQLRKTKEMIKSMKYKRDTRSQPAHVPTNDLFESGIPSKLKQSLVEVEDVFDLVRCNEELSTAIAQMRGVNQALDEKIHKLEASRQSSEFHFNSVIRAVEDKLSKSNEALRMTEQTLQSLREELSRIKMCNSSHQEKWHVFRKWVVETIPFHAKVLFDKTTTEEHPPNLEQILDLVGREYMDAKTGISELREKVSDLASANEQKSNRMSELELQISEARSRLDRSQMSRETDKQEIARLNQTLEDERQRSHELDLRIQNIVQGSLKMMGLTYSDFAPPPSQVKRHRQPSREHMGTMAQ